MDHAENAAYDKAAKDLDNGNTELQKSIDAYGDDDKAVTHYDRAAAHFDDALDLIVLRLTVIHLSVHRKYKTPCGPINQISKRRTPNWIVPPSLFRLEVAACATC